MGEKTMAGVPTSTGCDACRKQRKKCHPGKPACSRCTRLGIPCIGGGKIRYKFKDHFLGRGKENQVSSSHDPKPDISSSLTERRPLPSQGPGTSQSATRSGALSFLLDMKDPRYDLTSYGVFLKDLPRRMGYNEALDAAVDVVVDSYAYLRTRQSPRGSLAKYVNALQALQRCLNDREKARDSATLCAIYLIMICQGWTGADSNQKTTHGEGLAHLLDATIVRRELDSFETLMRDTLYVPVLLESIYRPKMRQSRCYLEMKKRAHGLVPAFDGEKSTAIKGPFAYLVDIPDFLSDPAGHLVNISCAYRRIRAEMPAQKQALDQLDKMIWRNEAQEPPVSSYDLAKLHIQHQILWALLLLPALLCNSLLRALGAATTTANGVTKEQKEEAREMVDFVVALAKSAERYRPFGAGFMPLCLIAAWAATEDDAARRAGVERALDAYRGDFSEETAAAWGGLAACLGEILGACARQDSVGVGDGFTTLC